MKKTLLLTLGLLVSMLSHAQRNDRGLNFGNTRLPASLESVASWDLLTDFSDDFNHNNKNSGKFQNVWSQSYLPDPGFTGPGSTRWVGGNGVEVRNGKLEIIARPGPGGLVNCGIVTSKRTIKYPVYMEARIKVSNIRNSSNFWMLNACDNEEIDVLEVYGGDPDQFYSKQMSTNFHIWHRQGGQSHAGAQTNVNCGGQDITDFTYQTFFTTNPNSADLNSTAHWRDAYHTFGVYWGSPTQIEFYIDGQPRFNGQHFVGGRNASGLNGSFKDARMQCPNAAVLRCATSELLRNVQGQSGGGVRYPNREFNDPTFIILDTEAHAGRPVESTANLNNNNRNVMRVDWVRVYRPNFGGGGTPAPAPAPAPTPAPAPAPAPAPSGGGNNSSGAPIGRTIWLKANNGAADYVQARLNQGNVPLGAVGGSIGTWEQFTVVDGGNGTIALRARANNLYVQARINETNAPLYARGAAIRGWERFIWESRGNGKVALKSNQNGRYVQARLHLNGAPLAAFATNVAGWETFNWGIAPGGKELTSENSLASISPNPAHSNSTIVVTGATIGESIAVYNANGQKVSEITATSEEQEVELGTLSTGIYFVKLNGGTLKLLVN